MSSFHRFFNFRTCSVSAAAITASLWASAGPAAAGCASATPVWGGTTGNWFTPGNWVLTCIPDSGSATTVGSGDAQIASLANSSTLAISGGTVELQSGGRLTIASTGGLSVTGGGTLLLNGSSSIIINGATSGATSAIALNSSTIRAAQSTTLSNNINYLDGNNEIDAASGVTLTLTGQPNADSSTSTSFGGGGTIVLANGGFWYGGGTVTIKAGATLQNGNQTGQDGLVNTTSLVDNGALVYDLTSGTSVTYGGLIVSGSGTLSSIGAGSVALSASNTYSGGTILTSGIIGVDVDTVGTPGAITSSAIGTGSLTFNGGTLQAENNTRTIANAVFVNSTGGTIDPNYNQLIFSGVIADGSGGPGILNIGTGNTTGEVKFSGANTYSSATIIASGQILQAGAANSFSPNSPVTVGLQSHLDINGFNQSIPSLAGTYDFSYVENGGNLAATLTLTGSSNTSFAGVIQDGSASLGLIKSGTATLTLSHANTYTGGTLITGGLINFNNAGHFPFPNAGNFGAGLITLNGGGLQWATGTSDDISGKLKPIGSNGGVFDTNGNDVSFGTALSGGAITKTGSGTLTLSVANTYTGGTHLNGGTIAIGDAAALGTGTLSMADGTTLANSVGYFFVSNPVNLAGTDRFAVPGGALIFLTGKVSGTGILNITGDNGGAVVLENATNDYSGGTVVGSSAVMVLGGGGGNVTGTGAITFQNGSELEALDTTDQITNAITTNGTFSINVSNTLLTLSGVISGNGGIRIYNTNGVITLSSANTYKGGTDVESSATLAIGDNAALGTGGVILVSATLRAVANVSLANAIDLQTGGFDGIDTQANNLTLTGVISDTGGLSKSGSGTLTLTNASNSYAGGTNINAGTLVISNSGAIGTGDVLLQNSTLQVTAPLSLSNNFTIGTGKFPNRTGTFDTGANTLTLSGVFSGAGPLIKTSSGTLTLTGNSSGFTGGATVNAGVLIIGTPSTPGAALGGTITVNGGTLKGNGAIGGLAAASGSTVAPGNSIGTLNVTGNISFASGSVYQAEVDNTGASDKIIATGTATIASGASVNVLAAAGNYGTSTSYTIINATGGVTGTFGSVTSNLAFLTPSLSYTGSSVVLTLAQSATFPSVATTPNQIAAAAALQAVGSGSLYGTVLGASASTALAAFDASSGEIYATTLATQLQAATAARRTVLERMRHTDPDQGWSLWGAIANDWGSIASDGNAAKVARTGVDLTVGLDTVFSSHWGIGLEGGYNGGTLSVAARASHAAISDGHVGAYTWGSFDGFVARGGFYYGAGTGQTTRTIAFTGFTDTATSRQDTNTSQLYGELGYDIAFSGVTVEPFAGLDWTNVYLGKFRETGGAAALSGSKRNLESDVLTLGVQATPGTFDLFGMSVSHSVRAAWQHGFTQRTPSRTLTFVAGGPAFTVAGAPLDQDRALLDASAAISFSDAFHVSLGYAGAFGARSTDHTVRLTGEVKL